MEFFAIADSTDIIALRVIPHSNETDIATSTERLLEVEENGDQDSKEPTARVNEATSESPKEYNRRSIP